MAKYEYPDVTALGEYIDENRLPLLTEAALIGRSLNDLNIMSGIKYKTALNILSGDVELQSADDCGWSAKGGTKFTQRVLEVVPLKINQEYCPENWRQKWANYQLRVTAGKENLPFEEYITKYVVDKVNAQLDQLIWQGNTATGATDELKLMNGFLALLDGNAKEVEFAGGETAYEKIKAVYLAIPAAVKPKAKIFVGLDTFTEFMQDMVEKNYFHYVADGEPAYRFRFPGSVTEVVGVEGLSGTGAVVAADPDNLVYGTDYTDDKETMDVWYDRSTELFKLKIKFLAGVQVAFPDEVVYGHEA